MKKKMIGTRVLVLALFFLTAWFGAAAQTQLMKHTVKEGETLYRLSLNYGVTVNQILQYNPGLSSGALKSGSTILVPFTEPGHDYEQPQQLQAIHKVRRKETLFSISQKYGITIDELKRANPEMKASDYQLKKGSDINIPYPSARQQPAARQQTPKQPAQAALPANGYSPVRIAVMLPFCSDAVGSNRCIEFYRGFLLAVEKMQAEGKNVEIYAYNEPQASTSVVYLLEEIRLKRVNLLVGPLYFDHFAAVSQFAEINKVKTLIPFSSKMSEIKQNPYLYLLNAPEEDKHLFAANLFVKNFTDYKVVFMASDSRNERNFTQRLRQRLLQEGVEVGDVSTASSDEQIQAACHSKKLTVFIPDGSSDMDFEKSIDRILRFKRKYAKTHTAFFAYPEWQKFVLTRQNDFHKVNTYVYTNAFYNPWSATTNELKRKYTAWFKSDIIETMPRMFMLGYDTGLTFISGLAHYGKDFNTQELKLPLQQSDIAFKRASRNGGYVNSSMWFIHYRYDFQIEKVSER